MGGNKYLTAMQRFEAAYIPVTESGCWLWTQSITSKGYAKIGVNSKNVYAHRYAYEAFRGPIPNGMHIDHLCRVRSCVNPWHLEVVTPRENVLRGVGITAVSAKATHCKYGHPLSGCNLRFVKKGRVCRECAIGRNRAHRRKKVAA